MTFALGSRSLTNAAGMHPVLLDLFKSAIADSAVDFGFTEPQVRTLEYQRTLVARGVSQTLRSNHIACVDLSGQTRNVYGHAGDAVPWVNGKWSWDWAAIYEVQAAVARAAARAGLGDKVCWGGCWDRYVGSYGGPAATAETMRAATADYVARRRAKGLRSFPDGPHVQIYRLG